ncbi:TonB-dependent receptor domain-containing protein [Pseudofulvibacter geojedonensis]|uniref:TonB-dependent receptor domain-containing protein n=1 Tax=Pseudofulvibacter geojedonensis TaxID=1123758 RepID=A0ABW3I292_9FLAO
MDCKIITKIVLFFVLFSSIGLAQETISGVVTDQKDIPLAKVAIYNSSGGLLTQTNHNGLFSFVSQKQNLKVVLYLDSYSILEKELTAPSSKVKIVLHEIGGNLTEVELTARRKKVFALKRLKDVEETAIYAGKKTEVVLVEESLANIATNNTRQLYNQVAGLNIYETDDAGLQLSIGGRGLDPNRTANFNTRQNGYDISADVLGYPESYYTPAAEGLSEIQIIRGAASLQYGTQFGGLINFKMKEPNPNKKIELISRFTTGSNGLATNFTSLSGTANKFSYYTYYNYKQGDGFRDNSRFESKNAFGHFVYDFTSKTKLSADITYMNYLAQQAGGLTDRMFEEDPFQSNRSRNWFQVNWLLYNLKLAHKFSEKTNATINFFGLNASRDALGYRTNRVSDADDLSAPRDLIKGKFRNFGLEARLVHRYSLFNKKSTFLIGTKYYNARNKDQQGPGTTTSNANFDFDESLFDSYHSQSNFTYPNQNLAVFGENIFYINDKLSITPGFRFEYIKTETEGRYIRTNTLGNGTVVIVEDEEDNRVFDRSFVLLGLGVSYKPLDVLEVYGNISQNYRSVTFSDIRINNPSYEVDPNITDEKGFTADIGVRGNLKKIVSYDVGLFGLFYNDRIGLVQRENSNFQVKNVRTNIGDAVMYGLESLIDIDVSKLLIKDNDYRLNVFANTSVLDSYYVDDSTKNVEFVPDFNFKTGVKFGYKDLLGSVQYSYLSQQFTDATNATGTDSVTGLLGPIPSYDVLDLSLSYTYKRFKLETGINNVLDNHYFTRRATGYPGPGIIPSAPRNWYATLQVKL